MRILVGFIWDGKGSGIDVYLMAFARAASNEGVQLDFLTNEYDESLAVELKRLGHGLYEIATLHDRSSQKATIHSLCASRHYDAAYFNVSTALMYPVVKDARDEGVSCIAVHSHAAGNDQRVFAKRVLFDLIHYCLRGKMRKGSTHMFASSTEAAGWLFGKRVSLNDVVIVPNPVNVDAFVYDPAIRAKIRKEMNLTGKTVIGSVTAMKQIKNPYLLIDVFAEYHKTHNDAYLLVVGEGELFDGVLSYAGRLLDEGTYAFLGKRSDIPRLLQAFDAFVLTSEKEGLSIATLEAQISGLPCLISDGIPCEAVVVNSIVRRAALNQPASDWANILAELIECVDKEGRRSFDRDIIAAGYCLDSPRLVLEKIKV